MSNDEKMCPLTKMTCYGKECAWWRHPGCCAISTISNALHGRDLEVSRIANELCMIRQDFSELERRL